MVYWTCTNHPFSGEVHLGRVKLASVLRVAVTSFFPSPQKNKF